MVGVGKWNANQIGAIGALGIVSRQTRSLARNPCARLSAPGAKVASETPGLAAYYAARANRPDLVCVPLADPNQLQQLREGDFVIDARGRRYFSNEQSLAALEQSSAPAFQVSLGNVPSASVFMLDRKSLEAIVAAARGT